MTHAAGDGARLPRRSFLTLPALSLPLPAAHPDRAILDAVAAWRSANAEYDAYYAAHVHDWDSEEAARPYLEDLDALILGLEAEVARTPAATPAGWRAKAELAAAMVARFDPHSPPESADCRVVQHVGWSLVRDLLRSLS